MAKGEKIFKRKDGRWEARYWKDRDENGRIIYGYCYGKTYRETKSKLAACKVMVVKDLSRNNDQIPKFASYCHSWMEAYQHRRKHSTQIKYHSTLERYILPEFGSCTLREISTEQIAAFTDELLTVRKLAPKTVRDILTILNSILKFAGRQQEVPVIKPEIVFPRQNRKEIRVLSLREQEKLVEYLREDMDLCKFGVLLTLMTGLRLGELCALQWKHISLAERVIHVTGTMQRLKIDEPEITNAAKTRIVIDTPKSDMSLRMIPMTDAMVSLCQQMKPRREDAYLLTGTGRYMEPRTMQNRIYRYAKDCELEGVHFHTLRHTFATRCIEVGFEVKSLSEILGHASVSITLNRYVHASLSLKRANMEKLAVFGF